MSLFRNLSKKRFGFLDSCGFKIFKCRQSRERGRERERAREGERGGERGREGERGGEREEKYTFSYHCKN